MSGPEITHADDVSRHVSDLAELIGRLTARNRLAACRQVVAEPDESGWHVLYQFETFGAAYEATA